MIILLRLLQALGLNAVPFLGVSEGGWTSGTTIALYWFESVLASILIFVRIVLHGRATNKRGHYVEVKVTTTRNGRSSNRTKIGSFATPFLLMTIGFSLAQAVFLAFMLRFIGGVDVEALKRGLIGVAAFLVVGFLLDLRGLRDRPFAWIRRLSNGVIGRVIAMHLFVMIGFFIAAVLKLPNKVMLVFVVLKTMNDLSMQVPQYNPQEAPRLLVRLLGNDFADYWRKSRTNEIAGEAEDEEPFTGVPSGTRRPEPMARGRRSRLPS